MVATDSYRLAITDVYKRQRLLMHEGRDDDTEDNRDNDDRQAPVMAEVIEELDNVEDPVFKDIPQMCIRDRPWSTPSSPPFP